MRKTDRQRRGKEEERQTEASKQENKETCGLWRHTRGKRIGRKGGKRIGRKVGKRIENRDIKNYDDEPRG